MCEDVPLHAAAQAIQSTGNYDTLTLVLAAVAVIVTALGVIFTVASVVLGAMALRGYKELKEGVIQGSSKAATEAVEAAIAKFPNPEVFTRQLRDEAFALLKAEPVASISTFETSKTKVESVVMGAVQPVKSEDTEKPISEPYPGEVKENAGSEAGPSPGATKDEGANPEDRPPDGSNPSFPKGPSS
jgi:hypothetical protein